MEHVVGGACVKARWCGTLSQSKHCLPYISVVTR